MEAIYLKAASLKQQLVEEQDLLSAFSAICEGTDSRFLSKINTLKNTIEKLKSDIEIFDAAIAKIEGKTNVCI